MHTEMMISHFVIKRFLEDIPQTRKGLNAVMDAR